MEEKVFVYGAGGHAKVVLNILDLMYVEVAAVLDDREELDGHTLLGHTILFAPEALPDMQWKGITNGVVAIGNNRVRAQIAENLREMGFSLLTAVHPTAIIDPSVLIGEGTMVMAGVIINNSAIIGENVILNTGCTIDHDCRIGDHVHISPGVHLGGCVTIGDYTQVGIGASVLPNVHIGERVIVGGGAAVIRPVRDGYVAVGVPAQEIKRNEEFWPV